MLSCGSLACGELFATYHYDEKWPGDIVLNKDLRVEIGKNKRNFRMKGNEDENLILVSLARTPLEQIKYKGELINAYITKEEGNAKKTKVELNPMLQGHNLHMFIGSLAANSVENIKLIISSLENGTLFIPETPYNPDQCLGIISRMSRIDVVSIEQLKSFNKCYLAKSGESIEKKYDFLVTLMKFSHDKMFKVLENIYRKDIKEALFLSRYLSFCESLLLDDLNLEHIDLFFNLVNRCSLDIDVHVSSIIDVIKENDSNWCKAVIAKVKFLFYFGEAGKIDNPDHIFHALTILATLTADQISGIEYQIVHTEDFRESTFLGPLPIMSFIGSCIREGGYFIQDTQLLLSKINGTQVDKLNALNRVCGLDQGQIKEFMRNLDTFFANPVTFDEFKKTFRSIRKLEASLINKIAEDIRNLRNNL